MDQGNQKLRALLNEYGASHQHPGNHRIHLFCVPAIMLSIFGMSDSLPSPISPAFLLAGLGLLYFVQFRNVRVYGVLLAELIPMLALVIFSRGILKWQHWLALFVAAWIGQFVGHLMEGKKPSFFQDIFFLLIGPIWIFRRFLRL